MSVLASLERTASGTLALQSVELRTGLNNLLVEDATKLRIFKIDTDFIRKAKADGVPLEVEKLVEKRILSKK